MRFNNVIRNLTFTQEDTKRGEKVKVLYTTKSEADATNLPSGWSLCTASGNYSVVEIRGQHARLWGDNKYCVPLRALKDKVTSLMEGVKQSNVEMVKLLLDHGADANQIVVRYFFCNVQV